MLEGNDSKKSVSVSEPSSELYRNGEEDRSTANAAPPLEYDDFQPGLIQGERDHSFSRKRLILEILAFGFLLLAVATTSALLFMKMKEVNSLEKKTIELKKEVEWKGKEKQWKKEFNESRDLAKANEDDLKQKYQALKELMEEKEAQWKKELIQSKYLAKENEEDLKKSHQSLKELMGEKEAQWKKELNQSKDLMEEKEAQWKKELIQSKELAKANEEDLKKSHQALKVLMDEARTNIDSLKGEIDELRETNKKEKEEAQLNYSFLKKENYDFQIKLEISEQLMQKEKESAQLQCEQLQRKAREESYYQQEVFDRKIRVIIEDKDAEIASLKEEIKAVMNEERSEEEIENLQKISSAIETLRRNALL